MISCSQLSSHANQAGMSFSARSEGTQASGVKETSCQTGHQEEELKLRVLTEIQSLDVKYVYRSMLELQHLQDFSRRVWTLTLCSKIDYVKLNNIL